MAAVNFYRFASAIMELLEPKTQTQDSNYNSNNSIGVSSNEIASSAIMEQTKSLALQAQTIAIINPQTTEVEAKTVVAVAANLTQALATASDEKLVQVAEVIKQVAVENTPTISNQPTVLTQTLEQAKTVSNVDEAAQIVQATVNALATQTIENLSDFKTALPTNSEAKTTEVMTNVLTDKIQQKTAERTETASVDNPKIIEPIKIEPEDFWLKYDEIDPSKIKYYGTVSYLYDYMTGHSMLDYLNPEIDLLERYQTMTGVVGLANQKYGWETNLEQTARDNNNSQLDKARESEQDLRQDDARKQEQLQLQQRLEQQKMLERIAAERLKEAI